MKFNFSLLVMRRHFDKLPGVNNSGCFLKGISLIRGDVAVGKRFVGMWQWRSDHVLLFGGYIWVCGIQVVSKNVTLKPRRFIGGGVGGLQVFCQIEPPRRVARLTQAYVRHTKVETSS